jgi:gamma-glutamylcyclotransferase (GGCT)/AIG2-like uncharacterized protein YtfP
MHLFVYGSLRQGFPNHFFLAESKYIGEFTTAHKYVMIGQKSKAFPFVVYSHPSFDSTVIHGELYDIDENVLKSIDALEGHPEFYRRRMIIVTDGTISYIAQMYILENKGIIDGIIENMGETDSRFEVVESGNWSSYCQN